jgi:hypothetical protein
VAKSISSNFGPQVDTCSDIETVTPRAIFFSFAFRTRFIFCKTDKKQGRHQAKDYAQLLMLRDSFLDLIPALGQTLIPSTSAPPGSFAP